MSCPLKLPGVHTLWLPVIPMQVGLVLKPGPQEPWTPYRMAAAFFEAGVPRESISIYPGGSTLVCSAITEDAQFQRQLIDAQQIDRLNRTIPTMSSTGSAHEGDIVEFLFRPRAFQAAMTSASA